MAAPFLRFSSATRLASVRTFTCTQRLPSAAQSNVVVEPEVQENLESEDESNAKVFMKDRDVGHQYACLKNIHLPEKLDKAIKEVLSCECILHMRGVANYTTKNLINVYHNYFTGVIC